MQINRLQQTAQNQWRYNGVFITAHIIKKPIGFVKECYHITSREHSLQLGSIAKAESWLEKHDIPQESEQCISA